MAGAAARLAGGPRRLRQRQQEQRRRHDDRGRGTATHPGPAAERPDAAGLGKGEGALNLIAWAGYAEDGSTDPAYNWVKPFEDQTGCKTNVKIGNTSDEMVSLMKTGQYDGVSASGDATLRLVYGGDVAPVEHGRWCRTTRTSRRS